MKQETNNANEGNSVEMQQGKGGVSSLHVGTNEFQSSSKEGNSA